MRGRPCVKISMEAFFLCCYIKGGQLMGGTLVKISEAFLCYGAGWRAWE